MVVRQMSRLYSVLPICRSTFSRSRYLSTCPASALTTSFERPDLRFGFTSLRDQRLPGAVPLTWCVFRGYAKKAKKEKVVKGKKGHVVLNQEEIGDIIDFEATKSQMQHALDNLKEEYIHNLTLRTSSGVFDSLRIDTDDGSFPLNQLGQIVQKNPHLLLINLAATPQYVQPVLAAISGSGLNVNPQQEGSTIFIPIPKVTREHRENLAKSAKMLCDKTKTNIREIQNKAVKVTRAAKATHSEDIIRNLQEMILDEMHDYSAKADKMLEKKKQELLGDK